MSWTVDSLTYPTRRKITIQVSELLDGFDNFPILVKLTSSNFNFEHSNSDGYDIRFTSSDGTTLLKYERLRHDSANSLAEYWVKIPTISSSVDTEFYIYFRTDDTANGEDKTNVWDSGFEAVWHLNGSYNGTSSEVLDSTGNTNHGTAGSAPTQVAGKISKAQDFNGVDTTGNYISFPSIACLNATGEFTVELILSTDGNGGKYRTVYTTGDYFLLRNPNDSDALEHYNFTTKNPDINAVDMSTGTWYHIAFTWRYDVDSGEAFLYQNGVAKDSTTDDTFGSAIGTALYFGLSTAHTNRYWDGKMEEIRVSNVARSEEWLNATYKACYDLLNTYGAMEGYPAFSSSLTDTITVVETFILNATIILTDAISFVESLVKRKILDWANKIKNITTWGNKTKNTTTFSNKTKRTTTWSNKPKS